MCGRCVFEEEPGGSVLQRAEEVLVEVECGDHDDGDRISHTFACEGCGSGDAVASGHPHIHQHHIRAIRFRVGDGFGAAAGLGDDSDVVLRFEERAQGTANTGLVVGDEHVDHRNASDRVAGSVSVSVQSPFSAMPVSSWPERMCARSAAPISP